MRWRNGFRVGVEGGGFGWRGCGECKIWCSFVGREE